MTFLDLPKLAPTQVGTPKLSEADVVRYLRAFRMWQCRERFPDDFDPWRYPSNYPLYFLQSDDDVDALFTYGNPMARALTMLAATPRHLRAALRAVVRKWSVLHGAVSFDHLLVTELLRTSTLPIDQSRLTLPTHEAFVRAYSTDGATIRATPLFLLVQQHSEWLRSRQRSHSATRRDGLGFAVAPPEGMRPPENLGEAMLALLVASHGHWQGELVRFLFPPGVHWEDPGSEHPQSPAVSHPFDYWERIQRPWRADPSLVGQQDQLVARTWILASLDGDQLPKALHGLAELGIHANLFRQQMRVAPTAVREKLARGALAAALSAAAAGSAEVENWAMTVARQAARHVLPAEIRMEILREVAPSFVSTKLSTAFDLLHNLFSWPRHSSIALHAPDDQPTLAEAMQVAFDAMENVFSSEDTAVLTTALLESDTPYSLSHLIRWRWIRIASNNDLTTMEPDNDAPLTLAEVKVHGIRRMAEILAPKLIQLLETGPAEIGLCVAPLIMEERIDGPSMEYDEYGELGVATAAQAHSIDVPFGLLFFGKRFPAVVEHLARIDPEKIQDSLQMYAASVRDAAILLLRDLRDPNDDGSESDG